MADNENMNIEERVTDLEGTVQNLSTSMAEMTTQISSINSTLMTIQSSLSAITGQEIYTLNHSGENIDQVCDFVNGIKSPNSSIDQVVSLMYPVPILYDRTKFENLLTVFGNLKIAFSTAEYNSKFAGTGDSGTSVGGGAIGYTGRNSVTLPSRAKNIRVFVSGGCDADSITFSNTRFKINGTKVNFSGTATNTSTYSVSANWYIHCIVFYTL